ncbi:MAG: L,D-transpeptidase [bacterium]
MTIWRRLSRIILFIIIQSIFCLVPVYADNTKIFINIPSRTLELFKDGKIVKTYPIGVGKSNFQTPIGNFKVISKVIQPCWENPYKPTIKIKSGNENPLGSRWIGFYTAKNGVYGIHGTNNSLSVKKYCSHGCIRMYIKDAEDLFIRVELGTPIKIAYYPYKLITKNNKLIIQKYPHVYNLKINPQKLIDEQLKMLDKAYTINPQKLNQALKLKNGMSVLIGEIRDI